MTEMDKTCSIVQDLLPLYEEDMLREETKEFVDGHYRSARPAAPSLTR